MHPSNFGLPPEQTITAGLNKKYANRVLHDVGLCVCVFDLTAAGEGKVRYGDGYLWYKGPFISSDRTSQILSEKQLSSDWSSFDPSPRR